MPSFISLISLSWLFIATLPNYQDFYKHLSHIDLNLSLAFVAYYLVFKFLFQKNEVFLLSKIKSGLLITIAIVSFFYLSFRSDALFLGSSELHWEYFVGPIRTLRHGGWLLWDTPSQYGFLNILLASLLPFKSEWQSLYVFQGFLLFFSSIILLYVFHYLSNNNFYTYIPAKYLGI